MQTVKKGRGGSTGNKQSAKKEAQRSYPNAVNPLLEVKNEESPQIWGESSREAERSGNEEWHVWETSRGVTSLGEGATISRHRVETKIEQRL